MQEIPAIMPMESLGPASTLAEHLNSTASSKLQLLQDLSVLVITYAGKWRDSQFHPSCNSARPIEWFEGTGTVIGIKRNRVFILSSIHCAPTNRYSFFVKGSITSQEQKVATLCANRFVPDDNGIDIAIFSCGSSGFDSSILQNISNLMWKCNAGKCLENNCPLFLIHFPTQQPGIVPITDRLENAVFPVISEGTLISTGDDSCTIDSTITATAGSSGGLVMSADGMIVATHDSQHDETPDGRMVSTHRLINDTQNALSDVRCLDGMLGYD
jgi:hypothetical protein